MTEAELLQFEIYANQRVAMLERKYSEADLRLSHEYAFAKAFLYVMQKNREERE